MKDFPRIRRLSTLGIVHHQHFDYEFNPFRTDFVGDGGAGKSMISDLLQLICVGPKYFHSPTKSTGPRKPSTMVLRTDGKGTDMAYAFINVEIDTQQYVVMGIYLESSGTANMFIIQNGDNFEPDTALVPFDRLLGVEDFVNNNTIFPISVFKDYINNTLGLTCQSWERTSLYHKVLFNNDILPLDLSNNTKTLENYAKLIQAFSRESLDVSKSGSLQSFLFGDEKEKEIKNRFYDTIDELKDDTHQFEINLQEIELLTNKQTELNELLQLKLTKEKEHYRFLIASYKHYSHLLKNKTEELVTRLTGYYHSLHYIPLLRIAILDKIDMIKGELSSLEEKYLDSFRRKEELKAKNEKRERFSAWMQLFKVSSEELAEKYNKYHTVKDSLEKVNYLLDKLKSKNIAAFSANAFSEKNILFQIESNITSLTQELDVKNKLKALNNIENKFSLANWALNFNRALTSEEEAIIRKFQNENILVQQPSQKNLRYIPRPEDLLENLTPYKSDNDGFWLNLNGVIEFFATDFEQVFNTKNTEDIRRYFQDETSNIANDINRLKCEIADKEILKSIFEELEHPDTYIVAWNANLELADQFQTHEIFDLSRQDFLEYNQLYLQPSIEDEYEESLDEFNKYNELKIQLQVLEQNLAREVSSLIIPFKDNQVEQIMARHKIFLSQPVDEIDELLGSYTIEDYYPNFVSLYNIHRGNYQHLDKIVEIDLQINDLRTSLNEIIAEQPDHFLDFQENTDSSDNDITISKDRYRDAQNNYQVKYRTIVNQFIKNKVSRLEGSEDFLELCTELLPPTIVNDITLLDKEVIEKIEKYLRDINLKNRKLNSRKLQKLSEIIEEVYNEVSEQKNSIRIIQNFLNEDDKKITGGHRVTLDYDNENSYSPDWMLVFSENFSKDMELGFENSLFESQKGITRDLEQYPSLAEKLVEAFHRSGGSRSMKPKIDELLNPKSYYGLKFAMKNAKGKRNDGSSSQTYSAIALLCMGKLKLLDKNSTGKIKKAVRFIAIDESEGLGSNFSMLYDIATLNDYQLLSLSIEPNKIDAKKQNIYMLHNNNDHENVNYDPVPIFGSYN